MLVHCRLRPDLGAKCRHVLRRLIYVGSFLCSASAKPQVCALLAHSVSTTDGVYSVAVVNHTCTLHEYQHTSKPTRLSFPRRARITLPWFLLSIMPPLADIFFFFYLLNLFIQNRRNRMVGRARDPFPQTVIQQARTTFFWVAVAERALHEPFAPTDLFVGQCVSAIK